MKKNLFLFISLIIIACLTTITSCKKDDDSNYGNANVHSKIFKNVEWKYSSGLYSCIISDADITQDIVDNGSVIVYVLTLSDIWLELPYVWPVSYTYFETTIIEHSLGQVKIVVSNSNGSQPDNPNQWIFKVVCINGL